MAGYNDNYTGGSETQAVTIDEVEVANRIAHCKDKTGAKIQATWRDVEAAFRIPEPGDIWTINRNGWQWVLDRRWDTGDDHKALTQMNPGDVRLLGNGRVDIQADHVSFNGEDLATVNQATSIATSIATPIASSAASSAVAGYATTAAGLYVPRSLAVGRGDTMVASASNTFARLPVGSGGTVPMADPTATNGISYRATGRGGGASGGDYYNGQQLAYSSMAANPGPALIGWDNPGITVEFQFWLSGYAGTLIQAGVCVLNVASTAWINLAIGQLIFENITNPSTRAAYGSVTARWTGYRAFSFFSSPALNLNLGFVVMRAVARPGWGADYGDIYGLPT